MYTASQLSSNEGGRSRVQIPGGTCKQLYRLCGCKVLGTFYLRSWEPMRSLTDMFVLVWIRDSSPIQVNKEGRFICLGKWGGNGYRSDRCPVGLVSLMPWQSCGHMRSLSLWSERWPRPPPPPPPPRHTYTHQPRSSEWKCRFLKTNCMWPFRNVMAVRR